MPLEKFRTSQLDLGILLNRRVYYETSDVCNVNLYLIRNTLCWRPWVPTEERPWRVHGGLFIGRGTEQRPVPVLLARLFLSTWPCHRLCPGVWIECLSLNSITSEFVLSTSCKLAAPRYHPTLTLSSYMSDFDFDSLHSFLSSAFLLLEWQLLRMWDFVLSTL